METCIKAGLNYTQYKDFILDCVVNNTTSGHDITPERVEFTKLNAQRMNRNEKQFVMNEELRLLISAVQKPLKWLVITEAWCGDSAQCIPVIEKVAQYSDKISCTYVFRDEHPELMEKYHTNGTLSIPKLICFDAISGEELWTWGPRPTKLLEIAKKLKQETPNMSHADFLQHIHLWYAKDRGVSLQEDLYSILKKSLEK